MKVRIYKPAKSTMQSVFSKKREWIMEFEKISKPIIDPLMGWVGSSNTKGQIRLYFETLENAQKFASRNNLLTDIQYPIKRKFHIKSYANNFSFKRVL